MVKPTVVRVDQVQLQAGVLPPPHVHAHDRVLQLGRDDHLEHVRVDAMVLQVAGRPVALLQQHELVQRIVPTGEIDRK